MSSAHDKPQDNDHLEQFRDRLNRNVRPQRDPKDRRGNREDMPPPGPMRPRGGDSSFRPSVEDTPSGAAPIRNRGWDATPSASARASARQSWDATPRSDRSSSSAPSLRGSARAKGEWDTPRINGRDYPEEQDAADYTPSERGGREWEEEQLRLDRDWYSYEESGVMADEDSNPFAQYEQETAAHEEELRVKELEEAASGGRKRVTARQAQYNADNDLWETNRLAQSGVTGARRKIDLDLDDEEESRVHLLVHDLKPPFLDGRMVFTKQLEPINPIKDATSDLAVFSKKGSLLVREKRAQAEREKAARKVAQLGGTSLGNLLGVKEGEEEAEAEKRDTAGPGTGKHCPVRSATAALIVNA